MVHYEVIYRLQNNRIAEFHSEFSRWSSESSALDTRGIVYEKQLVNWPDDDESLVSITWLDNPKDNPNIPI